jgi:transcription antitermination factor NusA-like protein
LLACETCIRSGYLCTNCQEKLDEGEITPFELDLAKDFLELEQKGKFEFLKDISFHKAIDFEDVVILVVGKKDKIRFSSELLDWIKNVYEIDKLILVEKTNNPRPVVESLITPGKLISLNEIFLATGDVEYKAVIQENQKDKILFTKEELEDLVHELTGTITRIEFI